MIRSNAYFMKLRRLRGIGVSDNCSGRTDKNETKVRYATGGLDNTMFVSKYLVVLPSEEELAAFIRQDRERLEALLQDDKNSAASIE